MNQTSKQVYGRVVKRKPKDQFIDEVSPQREVQEQIKRDSATRNLDFITVAEKVSESSIYYRNWYYTTADKHFRDQEWMRRVDKYFPYAKGGPLLFDEPMTESDMERSIAKAKTIRSLGFRFAIIEKDTTVYDALSQIGAI